MLQEKENAVLIGTTIDELIRHHPTLKAAVFDALKSTLSKVEELGNAFEPDAESRQWYMLTPVMESASGSEDAPMEDIQDSVFVPTEPSEALRNDGTSSSSGDDPSARPHDNTIVSFIDVLGRVSRCCSTSIPT
jgi:E3 ubiquitin-protein ligase HUWE1